MISRNALRGCSGRICWSLSGLFVASVSLIGLFGPGCSNTVELASSWNSQEAKIDVPATEWKSGLTEIKDSHVFVGIKNDQNYIYLRLLTTEEQFRRQMMRTGLTVWFESEEGKKLGILYPTGVFTRSGIPPSPNPESNPDPEERNRISQQALRDVELLGPGKNDRNLFSILELPGITVKLENSQGSTVYDLKVPLRESSDHPYALATAAGSMVKIGIETGKNESGSRPGGATGEGMGGGRTPGGGGPPAGGMPGGGRSGGGRMGGGRSGGGRPGGERPGGDIGGNRIEPLDFSAKVKLVEQTTK